MNKNKIKVDEFINLSGIIDEFHQVQLMPTLQAIDRPNLPKIDEELFYTARLLTREGKSIERPLYGFQLYSCDSEKRIGLQNIGFLVSLPKLKGAEKIQILHNGDIAYEQSITKPIKINKLLIKTDKERITITWKSSSKSKVAFAVSLIFSDGRNIPIGIAEKVNRVSFKLTGLPIGGTAVAEIRASDGVMSTTKRSKKFNIKPSSPLGTIISPPDNCEYRAWNPISLIGNCYDVLGDKLDWKKHEIVWRINGELQKNNIPKTVLKELPPGKYSIEIASNKWGVLSAHSIQIKSPTDDQDRHRQLFDKYDTIEMK